MHFTRHDWPISHVRFLCEKVAALNDSKRALRLVDSLLHRLHSSSFEMSDRELLLRGLHAVHALVIADGCSLVLPFLESGGAEQRARVLQAAVEINVRFEGQDATGRLAWCLLREVGPTSALESSGAPLLSYVLKAEARRLAKRGSLLREKEEADKHQDSSLRETSNVYAFLVNVMEQSTGDSQQVMSRYLIDFEKVNGEEKPEQGKEEQENEKEQEASGINDDLVDSQSLEESGEPQFTTKAPSIDMHLRDFLPGNQMESSMKMDVCECYCAASLWNSSGLHQEEKSREKIARRLGLRNDGPARVEKAFEELLHLQNPWMQGREGTDGDWEALQLEALGRFIFSMLLSYIRKKVKREPSGELDGFKLLFEAIRQWDADTHEKYLEQQFLLKELSIGRRNEHLPSWSGGVTKMRSGRLPPEFAGTNPKVRYIVTFVW